MALGEVYDIGKPTDGTVVGASAAAQTAIGGYFQGNNFDRGADFSGKDDIFRTHSATLSTNTTIASSDNSYAAGPLTIANGVTLTVSGNLSIAQEIENGINISSRQHRRKSNGGKCSYCWNYGTKTEQ